MRECESLGKRSGCRVERVSSVGRWGEVREGNRILYPTWGYEGSPGKHALKSSMLHRDSCLVVGVSTELNLK